MGTTWIEYKGKKILSVDYQGSRNNDELLKILQDEIEIEMNSNSKTLVLANMVGTRVGSRSIEAVKKAGKEIRPAKTNRTAVIGVEGVMKVLFAAYTAFSGDKNIKAFDTETEAKDWLVQ